MPNQDTILVFAWKIEENLEKPQNIFRPSWDMNIFQLWV
jgi:hypothetical protein